MFNVALYLVEFNAALKAIDKAEKVTKETLKDLSRSILTATHATGDIAYVNRLVAVLTPVNKKVVILYCKEFTGFMFDAESGLFTKKSKKTYDATLAKAEEFLSDPHNNVWSWAERNIDVEVKPLDLSKITAFIKGALKKADEQGIVQSEVLKAVFAAGVDVDALIVAMESIDGLNVNAE
jgi:hypothetical protein